ncbi:FHA domain-containing protein PS1 [Abrus precatorius]|uniref:FHA domain-containing protein PS1 n=1 Tax=Abrus precatorius TaxID=3816 RepID=A0A8B8KW40_ABRPR|nr:FHA domain-containing protein PS1 [Abrus precatorius]
MIVKERELIENQPKAEEEGKIPVLTVLKNNAILKNIFIVNKPQEEKESRDDHEDILLVGRHPDCDLMLTHPSISRFHLQICSKPASKTFFVLDLSSVHGTWVSERKIEPMVNVEMKEGDTLRIGVSSRVYRLHWIPISRAYDLENPFLSQLDVVVEEEEEEEGGGKSHAELCLIHVQASTLGGIRVVLLFSNLNCCLAENEEIESVDSILKDTNSLSLDENVEIIVKEEIPLAAGMLEDMVSLCCEEERKRPSKEDDLYGTKTSYLPLISGVENELYDSPPYVESVAETLTENLSENVYLPAAEAVLGTKVQQFHAPPDTFASPLPSGLENSFEKHYSSLPINTSPAPLNDKSEAEAVIIPSTKEFESECTLRDDGSVTDAFTAGAGIFNSENSLNRLLPAEEAMSGTKFQQIKVLEEVELNSSSDGEKQYTWSPPQLLNDQFCHDQGNSLDETAQDIQNKQTGSISPKSCQLESVNLSMPKEAVLNFTNENQTLQPDMETLESSVKAMKKNSTTRNIWSRRGKATSAPQVRTSKSILNKRTANVDTEVATSNEKGNISTTILKNLSSVLDREVEVEEVEEEEIFTPDKENFSPNALQLRFLKKGELEEIKHPKSQRSHNSKDEFNLHIHPTESIGATLCKKNQREIINKNMSKNLFSVLDGEEDERVEVYTPDKENFSPNFLQLRLLKKKGEVEEIKCSEYPWPQNSKDNFSCNMYPAENTSPTSNKENQIPKGAQYQKLQRKPFSGHIKLGQEQDVMTFTDRVKRVPFQSLKNPGDERKSGTLCPVSAAKSFDLSDCGQILDQHINPSDINGKKKKSWKMVVDTTSLLNKESRKALQLLQGLKGTRLIIPRLVIRELNSMKRQFTIFRRISEASLALEWIEECMVKTNWWIRIHSSVEEGGLIAPTPPAFPQTQFSEERTFLGGSGSERESGSSQPLSSHKFMDIASPTLEDHILDFALLYKRKHHDGQLALLSEDVTLKIKCMAEGLLCEPVQEFRESLVNPFSERFLWTNSSPRGHTWSCQDDVVLREKYCPLPLRKSSKGPASGLKLILLHNSQYGH